MSIGIATNRAITNSVHELIKNNLTDIDEAYSLTEDNLDLTIKVRITPSCQSRVGQGNQVARGKKDGFMEREKPKVIVLCGSSRFLDIMAVCGWILERDENAMVMGLHLLPEWYPDCPPDHLAEHEGCAKEMDELHLRKIDMADEVFVVNFNKYIGDSTLREIRYAKAKGRPVRWFTHDPVGGKVTGVLFNAREKHNKE